MKVKEVKLTWTDVPSVSDVLCIVEPRGGGAVTVLANAYGRDCLQKVFPNWDIPWEPNASAFPRDWLHAVFPIPELASRGGHNLPPINGSIPLATATPASLAFLLAIGAKNQGARAMTWGDEQEPPLHLFVPPQRSN
jgi:hypothetical protein